LRAKMEDGDGNCEDVLENKVMEEIDIELPLPIIKDETQRLFPIC